MSTPTSTKTVPEHPCLECQDLEHGIEQAEAERDLSRVTDFNVLIARHRRAHEAQL
ncbi:hypothetical protein [Streptomyces chattanoogensis]|uniref:hypothetical protein n=1 Tax=Streptomyces chattanoogensis TaxID=66876 RepID=UPI000B2CBDC7|nr:hypothetical protein [Streptomyces chattanoogensis]